MAQPQALKGRNKMRPTNLSIVAPFQGFGHYGLSSQGGGNARSRNSRCVALGWYVSAPSGRRWGVSLRANATSAFVQMGTQSGAVQLTLERNPVDDMMEFMDLRHSLDGLATRQRCPRCTDVDGV